MWRRRREDPGEPAEPLESDEPLIETETVYDIVNQLRGTAERLETVLLQMREVQQRGRT